jgi:hypothetical protein
MLIISTNINILQIRWINCLLFLTHDSEDTRILWCSDIDIFVSTHHPSNPRNDSIDHVAPCSTTVSVVGYSHGLLEASHSAMRFTTTRINTAMALTDIQCNSLSLPHGGILEDLAPQVYVVSNWTPWCSSSNQLLELHIIKLTHDCQCDQNRMIDI